MFTARLLRRPILLVSTNRGHANIKDIWHGHDKSSSRHSARSVSSIVRALHFDPANETIELTTPRGRYRFTVEIKTSYLDRSVVNAILSRASEQTSGKRGTKTTRASRIVLARYIPATVGEQLIAAGISFADEPGNVHVRLGDDYNWTVLGKREPPRAADADRTTPATIQLLFQFATVPQSATWTVRDLARATGIARRRSRCC